MPLPTRAQRYCDPASLFLFLHGQGPTNSNQKDEDAPTNDEATAASRNTAVAL